VVARNGPARTAPAIEPPSTNEAPSVVAGHPAFDVPPVTDDHPIVDAPLAIEAPPAVDDSTITNGPPAIDTTASAFNTLTILHDAAYDNGDADQVGVMDAMEIDSVPNVPSSGESLSSVEGGILSATTALEAWNIADNASKATVPQKPYDNGSSMFKHENTGSHAPDGLMLGSFASADTILPDLAANRVPLERADCTAEPPLFATSRQALCETVPYYRSHQSGGYCSEGYARAFLLDGHGHERDVIQANVVIARAGGGLAADPATGKMKQTQDQNPVAQIRSVKNSIEAENAVVLIMGQNNTTAGITVPHPYCVMGFFKVTHIWWEKSGGLKIVRMRFEKLIPESESWWKRLGDNPVPLGSCGKPALGVCPTCSKTFEQIYQTLVKCLNASCPDFWKHLDGTKINEDKLSYDPKFLFQYTSWNKGAIEPFDLTPGPLSRQVLGPEDDAEPKWVALRGMVCPSCKICDSRYFWLKWECPSCHHTQPISFDHITIASLKSKLYPPSAGPPISRDTRDDAVKLQILDFENYRVNIFTIDGLDGCIAHLMATSTTQEEANGPDWMWEELQTHDIGLERRRFASK
jgi:hypothetical protein